ncbi:MAG: YetF domain-containing protein [Candidatus Ornithomonoglobus sp.]
MMIIVVIRTLILYAVVITALRIMGKRQIGELQPSELVVAIMISDLATVPMESVDIPLLSGIIPVLTLIMAEVITSYLSLKSKLVRKFVVGQPSVVIYNGKINEQELERLRFNLDDLLEELRLNGCHDISDVEVAVIETSGKLSVIPRDKARPVTVEDMKLTDVRRDGLPCTVIADGQLNEYELRRSGKTKNELTDELKKHGAKSINEVFIASIDAEGELFIQLKNPGRR